MEANWAADHLQVIRTLMERSALYRRALAPIMLTCGVIGMTAATITCFVDIYNVSQFATFWLAVSVVALIASFLLVRRQALKEAEPFWSPPTRRVSQALLPAFVVGFAGALVGISSERVGDWFAWLLAAGWLCVYGCALHAAGSFMPRGIRLFGWIFTIGGCMALLVSRVTPVDWDVEAAHYLMGLFFGALHLAYGVYLYFTEKSRNAA